MQVPYLRITASILIRVRETRGAVRHSDVIYSTINIASNALISQSSTLIYVHIEPPSSLPLIILQAVTSKDAHVVREMTINTISSYFFFALTPFFKVMLSNFAGNPYVPVMNSTASFAK